VEVTITLLCNVILGDFLKIQKRGVKKKYEGDTLNKIVEHFTIDSLSYIDFSKSWLMISTMKYLLLIDCSY